MRSNSTSFVELISIDGDGLTIDDLLTARISPRVTWLERGLGIGDAGLHPAEPLLQVFEKIDLPDFFDNFDLTSIEEDGLESLQKIGGDGDGHEYVVGPQSGTFYMMWHGETSFEPVATKATEFIQWVARERSDHLQGCPCETFQTGAVECKTVWHREPVDPVPLLERAKELTAWTREYDGPGGFELFDARLKLDLRFKREHRGHQSHFTLMSVGTPPQVDAYLTWLNKRGFGRVWH